ncbi:26S protease regulatory subunit 8 like A [Glycine soja]|nr:26S protease regulatory subunit 8 like A [Glycine soja]
MALVGVEVKHAAEGAPEENCSAKPTKQGEGLRHYYSHNIHEHQLLLRQKTHNLNRLEAQRNELNSRVRMLREELQLLQEPGSYVGEVVKVMGKNKVLVKVHPEGKYVVDIDKSIDITKITPSTRVALRNDSYVLHLVLPSKVDPLVNLMKVEKVPDSTYDMIGGLDQQIKEIKEVIELPIKHPELFESLGIAQPKGVLLYGPPGTGKTLLARAVAHHTDCTFIRVSGSELVQKYIGEGSRMVRELFVMAREHAPSIIFMDEIDSIGSARMESGSGNGDSEVQRTMLELLNQLDGFEASNKIKVLMATNRIDILDQALLRPGRIDRKIEFPNPNEESRLDILKIHSRRMNLMRGIDLKKIAEKMNGASGAELKAVCTEAGMFALRERRVHVTQEDFEMAVAKKTKQPLALNNYPLMELAFHSALYPASLSCRARRLSLVPCALKTRSCIEEALVSVEACNMASHPINFSKLDGTWRLQYTSSSDVLVLLQAAATLPFFQVGQIFQKFECGDQSHGGVIRNVVRWSIPNLLEITVQDIYISEELRALIAPAILPRSFISLQISYLCHNDFAISPHFQSLDPCEGTRKVRHCGGLYYLSYLDDNMLLGRAVGGGGMFVFSRAQSPY